MKRGWRARCAARQQSRLSRIFSETEWLSSQFDALCVVRHCRIGYGRVVRYQRAEPPLKLDGLAAARSFFAGCYAEAGLKRETLWVAHLDEQANCVHLSRHEGDCCGVAFPLRTIVIDAARHASAAILLAHNHPSGHAQPSDDDLNATRRLATTAEALGCRLADHLVFAGSQCTSLRALGYL